MTLPVRVSKRAPWRGHTHSRLRSPGGEIAVVVCTAILDRIVTTAEVVDRNTLVVELKQFAASVIGLPMPATSIQSSLIHHFMALRIGYSDTGAALLP